MAWLRAYISSIAAANVALAVFGVVPVGFGLMAPAGVPFAKLSFTLRDLAQDETGRRGVTAAILLGAALSWFAAPAFGVASALSNVVGIAVDSCLFLAWAFGSLGFLAGLLLAKLYTIPPAMLLLAWPRRPRAVPLTVVG